MRYTDNLRRRARNCDTCHHFRQEGVGDLSLWCGLQRLPDPDGKVTVYHLLNNGAFDFVADGPSYSVARVQSPGPAFGFSADWRTGERRPHTWNPCKEYAPNNGRAVTTKEPTE